MAKANETKEEVKVVTEEKKNEAKPVNKNNGIIVEVENVDELGTALVEMYNEATRQHALCL